MLLLQGAAILTCYYQQETALQLPRSAFLLAADLKEQVRPRVYL